MKRHILFFIFFIGLAAISTAQTAAIDTFRQEGIASWYGNEFAGKPTASGEIFNPDSFTAAHPTLPFGTVLTVTNTQNMRRVTVRINDRGPFVAARIIDLSRAAAEVLDMINTGTAPVIVETAANTSPGPAAEIAQPAPVQQAPQPVPVQPAPVQTIPVLPAPVQIFQIQPVPVQPAPQPVPVQPAPVFYPAPPAEIKGSMPPAGSAKLYRLQVGAYRVPRNAVEAFDKLRSAGLNPAYEQYGDIYRVVLAGLNAAEIPFIAQTLGNAGFREAIIREEN